MHSERRRVKPLALQVKNNWLRYKKLEENLREKIRKKKTKIERLRGGRMA